MNRFSIDLKNFMLAQNNQDIVQAAHALGTIHKNEIWTLP